MNEYDSMIMIGVGFAILNAYIAHTKGRNTGGWAIAGFLAGLLATIWLACLSNKRTEWPGQ